MVYNSKGCCSSSSNSSHNRCSSSSIAEETAAASQKNQQQQKWHESAAARAAAATTAAIAAATSSWLLIYRDILTRLNARMCWCGLVLPCWCGWCAVVSTVCLNGLQILALLPVVSNIEILLKLNMPSCQHILVLPCWCMIVSNLWVTIQALQKNTTATGVKHCNLNTSPCCHQNWHCLAPARWHRSAWCAAAQLCQTYEWLSGVIQNCQ